MRAQGSLLFVLRGGMSCLMATESMRGPQAGSSETLGLWITTSTSSDLASHAQA